MFFEKSSNNVLPLIIFNILNLSKLFLGVFLYAKLLNMFKKKRFLRKKMYLCMLV